MQNAAVIYIDSLADFEAHERMLIIKSSLEFNELNKSLFALMAKNTIEKMLLCVDENHNNLKFLNRLIIHLKKLNSSLEIKIFSNYLIHDLYKQYKLDKLISDVYVNLSSSDIKNFLETGNIVKKEYDNPSQGREKILLIAPLAWSPQFPQLGLAYISASLKEEGYDVDLIDCNIDFFLGNDIAETEKPKYKNMPAWIDLDIYNSFTKIEAHKYIDRIIERIKNEEYKVVGLSIHHSSEIFSIDLLKRLKLAFPELKTMCGGPSTHMPFVSKAMKEGCLDLAIKGEGEFIVKEAVKYLLGEDAELDGCMTNENGKPREHKSKNLANINELILPDFTEFKIYDYENYRLPTSLSRGCVAKCSFCFETLYWKKFRIKKPENAVHEVMSLADKYKIRNFSVNDSLMNGSHKLLESFCDQLIKKEFPVSFYGYCRIDKKLSLTILEKMRQAGCQSISYGIESGSKRILEDMAKGVDKKYILPTLKNTKKANIRVVCCFIVGYPGEGFWDFMQTLVLILRSKNYIDDLNLAIFQPSHETKMMLNPDKFNLVLDHEDNWVSTELWNRPAIVRLKHNIIKYLWDFFKGEETSPEKWSYKYNMG